MKKPKLRMFKYALYNPNKRLKYQLPKQAEQNLHFFDQFPNLKFNVKPAPNHVNIGPNGARFYSIRKVLI